MTNATSGIVILYFSLLNERLIFFSGESIRKRSKPDSDVTENRRPSQDSALDVGALVEQAAKKRRLDLAGASMSAVPPRYVPCPLR